MHFFENVTKNNLNDETFKLLLYFNFLQIFYGQSVEDL